MRHKQATLEGGTKLPQADWEGLDTHYSDGQTANDMWYFNGTYWVRGTPATILTLLTAQAGAAFSWNNQSLSAVKQVQYKSPTALSIAGGEATVTQMFHTIDTQDNDPTDDLDTISGGTDGMLIILRPESGDRTVVVKHNTGNIWLPGGLDISLDDENDAVLLIYTNSVWIGVEVALTAHVAASDPHPGYVLESLFNAHTIVYATTDDTPAALTVGEQTLVGRITSGNIAALTPAQVMALLSGGAGASFSMNSQKITNVLDPTEDQDAATKKYVDDEDDVLDAALAAHEADTSTHGVDEVAGIADIEAQKLDDHAAPDDSTDNNASTDKHGLLPKLSGNSDEYLNGSGAWSEPTAAAFSFDGGDAAQSDNNTIIAFDLGDSS